MISIMWSQDYFLLNYLQLFTTSDSHIQLTLMMLTQYSQSLHKEFRFIEYFSMIIRLKRSRGKNEVSNSENSSSYRFLSYHRNKISQKRKKF